MTDEKEPNKPTEQLLPTATSPAHQIKASQRFTCVGCRVKFESAELQRAHFKTEWHLYNLKRRVCNLESIDHESFEQIQAAAPKVQPVSSLNGETSETIQKKVSSSSDGDDDDDDDDWEDVEIEEDEDYIAERMLANVIDTKTCLFCGQQSKCLNTNIEHMSLYHGFYIPEERYVIDKKGLINYLGYKVGAGNTCIWCDKQFDTVHGVRLHMRYKNHCKIFYDQEKAAEFKEFYDYADQETIAMRSLALLAPRKRKRHHHDDQQISIRTKSNNHNNTVANRHQATIAGTYQAKSVQKFNSQRAKVLLRIGMTNNNAMRGRLRQQNPI